MKLLCSLLRTMSTDADGNGICAGSRTIDAEAVAAESADVAEAAVTEACDG